MCTLLTHAYARHGVTARPTTRYIAVQKGDRVAQMVLERICMAPVVEVDSLPETARYVGRAGSLG